MLFDRAQVVAWAAERGLAAKAGFLAAGAASSQAGGRLERWLRAGGIWRDVPATEIRTVLARAVAALPGAAPAVRQMLSQRVHAADGITWAPVGGGLALPHLRSHVALGRDAGIVALVFLHDALPAEIESPPDDVPITKLFFFIAPSPRAHLDLIGRLTRALTKGTLQQAIVSGASDAEIFAAAAAADAAGIDRGRPTRRGAGSGAAASAAAGLSRARAEGAPGGEADAACRRASFEKLSA